MNPDVVPLAEDWDAGGHIHLDQWQSSSHLDLSGVEMNKEFKNKIHQTENIITNTLT